MVGVESFLVVLLSGVLASLAVEALEWTDHVEFSAANQASMEPLPTLQEYIETKKNKRESRTSRAYTQPPFIGKFYRYNSAVVNKLAVNSHILQVGVYALVASNGQEFRRHEYAEQDCINVGPTNLGKKNFFQCADAAAISPALSRFPYVVKSSFHGVGRVLFQWTVPDRCSVVAKYQIITVSGSEELRGGLGTYYYTTFNKALCNDNVTASNKTVTVVGYNFDNVELLRFSITPTTTGARRYPLSDGSCVLYDPSAALDLVSGTMLCQGMYATLPTASPAMPFTMYKQMIAAVPEPVEDHFTGAMLTSGLVWEWADLCTPVDPIEWDLKTSPKNFTLGTCSTSSGSDGYVLLQEDCDATQSVVCHDAAYRVINYDPSGLN